jgi:hypothetical protein
VLLPQSDPPETELSSKPTDWKSWYQAVTGISFDIYPACREGHMVCVEVFASIGIYFKPTLWPITATRGYIVKRIRLLSTNYESVFPVVLSGAKVRVYPERPVEDCFSALQPAKGVAPGLGSWLLVYRPRCSSPSRPVQTGADSTALH